MNLWECERPGCKSTAVGCGGAIGLRAIGWQFIAGETKMMMTLGPTILCPLHRTDGADPDAMAEVTQAAVRSVALVEVPVGTKYFQGPGTSGHPTDCSCAACRNFDD